MDKVHYINVETIDWKKIDVILSNKMKLQLSENSVKKIDRCRKYLDKRLENGEEIIYGINTGFGSLYNEVISKNDLGLLQKNLVMSHACGVGEEVPVEITKLMLLLKIQSLSYGNSGVQVSTVQRLIDFYNHDILPIVYNYGSLGASGDLAPLAHMSLPLIGMGEVFYKGVRRDAGEVLNELG